MEFLTNDLKEAMNKKSFLRKGLTSLLAVVGMFFVQVKIKGKEPPQVEKVKMLTPDGKLVWVDKSLLNKKSPAPPISNKLLQNWIKSRQT